MSVSDRKRKKQGGLQQLLRTFFQSYEESNGPDRMVALRDRPGGAVIAFFAEQALWRFQRSAFGITLREVQRLLDLARTETDQLRAGIESLAAEVAELRRRIEERSWPSGNVL